MARSLGHMPAARSWPLQARQAGRCAGAAVPAAWAMPIWGMQQRALGGLTSTSKPAASMAAVNNEWCGWCSFQI